MKKVKGKGLGVLVFGLGIIALLIGALTDTYSTVVGFIIMLGIWFILGLIVRLLTKGQKKMTEEFKETTKKEHWKDY